MLNISLWDVSKQEEMPGVIRMHSVPGVKELIVLDNDNARIYEVQAGIVNEIDTQQYHHKIIVPVIPHTR